MPSNPTPEQKLALVRAETEKAPTLYVGDGINDAPAMMAATVGGAIAQEVIDVLAVLNALRAAFPPRVISDL